MLHAQLLVVKMIPRAKAGIQYIKVEIQLDLCYILRTLQNM